MTAFLYRAGRTLRRPLDVEIDAIPERALIGRHRRPIDWSPLFEGWREMAEVWSCVH